MNSITQRTPVQNVLVLNGSVLSMLSMLLGSVYIVAPDPVMARLP